MKRTLLFPLFTAVSFGLSAQLQITDSLDAGAIADLLEGWNVSVQNVSINCAGAAMGHFTGNSEMEIEEGLVLSTGSVADMSGTASSFASTSFGLAGDPDLEALINGNATNDACILEFDCIPFGDTLLFNFSFGSEEYPEFVDQFNDVFAIFMTAPGTFEPVNVATLPSAVPVSINNVNAVMNSAYFHDNLNPEGQYVVFDGFTTNLTAFAVVQPNATYHFKVAIADALDDSYDSGVFLEAFSFRSTSISTGLTELMNNGIRILQQNDQLVVSAPEMPPNSIVSVYDLAGHLVRQLLAGADRTVIDLAGVGAGLFAVRVEAEGMVRIARFVRE